MLLITECAGRDAGATGVVGKRRGQRVLPTLYDYFTFRPSTEGLQHDKGRGLRIASRCSQ